MAAAVVVLQAGQVANEEPGIALGIVHDMHGERLVRVGMGEAVDLVDTHRIALLGHEQALPGRIVGQSLEALVAGKADAQGQLLGFVGIDGGGVLVQAHLDQALKALVGDDVDALADVLDGLGIAEPHQRDTADQVAVQGQLDEFRALVGDREEAVAVRVVGQGGNIVRQAFDGFGLDGHLVVRQPDGAIPPLRCVAPFLQDEQAPLEQTELLGGDAEQRQDQQQHSGHQPPRGQDRAHRKGLRDSGSDEGYRAHQDSA
ncbi:hypothetical protein D3C76_923550 [compost metagenome]